MEAHRWFPQTLAARLGSFATIFRCVMAGRGFTPIRHMPTYRPFPPRGLAAISSVPSAGGGARLAGSVAITGGVGAAVPSQRSGLVR